ncbi:MAG: hypothetical protein ABGW98_01295 [Myxococcales bacterium]
MKRDLDRIIRNDAIAAPRKQRTPAFEHDWRRVGATHSWTGRMDAAGTVFQKILAPKSQQPIGPGLSMRDEHLRFGVPGRHAEISSVGEHLNFE